MKFKGFTFKLTDDCNFNCSYCRQLKAQVYLKNSQIEKALHFFYPYFEEEVFINFYGGEPLLAFSQIKKAVQAAKKIDPGNSKAIQYTISTNASLIDDDILQYLIIHQISPLISFDVFAQDTTRKKGTFNSTVSVLEKLLTADLKFIVNSVFTPDTLPHLAASLQYLMDMGIPEIDFSLETVSPWIDSDISRLQEELSHLRGVLFPIYERTGTIPIKKFRGQPQKGTFVCLAGEDRMTLTPDGSLWGCHLFANYFGQTKLPSLYEKYSFGELDTFIKDHEKIYPKILENHAFLRMECFSTDEDYCLFCSEMEECGGCPVYSAFATGNIGSIPVWICKIRKVMRAEKRLFQRTLGEIY